MLRLIDLPKKCDISTYQKSIERVVRWISDRDFARSVYQVGSVKHPGISDLDLFVVAKTGSCCDGNPLFALKETERYPFTHSCFLVGEEHLESFSKTSILHGFRLIAGDNIGLEAAREVQPNVQVLRQIALEFVLKNYIDLSIQLAYKLVKARVFLQHVKGLRFDLELLKIHSGELHDAVQRGFELSDSWFNKCSQHRECLELAKQVKRALGLTLLEKGGLLYSPNQSEVQLSSNVKIKQGDRFEMHRRGFMVPSFGFLSERKHFNFNHRFNYFTMHLPMQLADSNVAIAERFKFQSAVKRFVFERFPGFAAPIPPLFYNAL